MCVEKKEKYIWEVVKEVFYEKEKDPVGNW